MKNIKRLILLVLLVALVWTGNLFAMSYSPERGTIRGSVHLDVDGDGRCVNSGVAGEVAVPGIDLTFTSVDGTQFVTLYSGSNGTYGLPSAGLGIGW